MSTPHFAVIFIYEGKLTACLTDEDCKFTDSFFRLQSTLPWMEATTDNDIHLAVVQVTRGDESQMVEILDHVGSTRAPVTIVHLIETLGAATALAAAAGHILHDTGGKMERGICFRANGRMWLVPRLENGNFADKAVETMACTEHDIAPNMLVQVEYSKRSLGPAGAVYQCHRALNFALIDSPVEDVLRDPLIDLNVLCCAAMNYIHQHSKE